MTTTKKIIASYKNNDYKVYLLEDGTKIRRGNSFNAIFPESLDLKITNYCDLACPFCHEHSTKRGKHGNMQVILNRLQNLPRGIELAIGGGNPLDHPDLIQLLSAMKEMGFIVNMTINSEHLAMEKYIEIADKVLPLIYGLGISGIAENKYSKLPNVVNHFIAGENSLEELKQLSSKYEKVLILGYKDYGRGEKYGMKNSDRIAHNISEVKEYVRSVVNGDSKEFNIVSFDNLAIRQLELKDMMGIKFDSFFMGDDGIFTMYYDGVTDMFAKSSTSPRIAFSNDKETIREVFKRYL